VVNILFGLPAIPRKALSVPAVHPPLLPEPSAASLATVSQSAGTTCLPPQPAAAARSLAYQAYSLTSLLKAFQAHKPQFSGADQQDSQEFLCELLDTFHEDLKLTSQAPAVTLAETPKVSEELASADPSGAGTVPAPSQKDTSSAGNEQTSVALSSASSPSPTSALTVQQQGERRWAQYLQQNASVVSHLFQGQMCSKIICKVCHTSSATFEPFTTLSMPIPRVRGVSASYSEHTTVVVTVHRKMPRLSQVLRLPDEAFENSVLTQGIIYDIYKCVHRLIYGLIFFIFTWNCGIFVDYTHLLRDEFLNFLLTSTSVGFLHLSPSVRVGSRSS
jgi:hypothetical protein